MSEIEQLQLKAAEEIALYQKQQEELKRKLEEQQKMMDLVS